MGSALKVNVESRNRVSEIDGTSPVLSVLKRPSRVHARGSILFREGQSLLGAYYLRSGSAKISISSSSGKTVILRVAKANDLLGLTSLIRGMPCESSAEIIEPARVNYLPRDEFFGMLTSKRVSDFVLRAVCRDANELVEATRRLLLADTIAERLASLLLEWCTARGAEKTDGITIPNRFTHQEIAEMIATSRETVTRVMGCFKKNNVIEISEDSIVVLEPESLEIIARRLSPKHQVTV